MKHSIITILLGLSLVGCLVPEPEETSIIHGVPGPTGDDGEQGTDGEDGQDGTDGTPGLPGEDARSHVYYASDDVYVHGPGMTEAIAQCDPGDIVIGGGCSLELPDVGTPPVPADWVAFTVNSPTYTMGAWSWHCRLVTDIDLTVGNGDQAKITARAICMQ